ncbi:MAG: ATP synthase subunit I [Rhodanobacteraceae bacterium]|nr:ATP synthase subunit I [Pseudomonadota bacterium]
MYNSIAAGRRLAVHMVTAQAGATMIAGLFFLARGIPFAVSAWCGGAVVVIGTALLALRVFAPHPAAGGATLGRFAVGMALKWIVVLGGFYLILARWSLPPLPALTGFGAAIAVNVLMVWFKR